MTAWFTGADRAELGVLIDGLVRGVLEHREHCAACASAGSAIYCRSVDKAIKIVLEWNLQRALLSRGRLPARTPERNRQASYGMSEAADLLDAVETFVRRFVVLSDPQAAAVALWIAHSHAFEAADTTPYLSITSAEMRSGKTRLLEVLELLVREPLPTANISDAALFRAISELAPTLLLDEVDAIYGPKARDREDLRGMLNAGYRQGAVARRMGGPRMTTLEAFPVYCAKAFAAIGKLPSTVADRAIGIRLERRTRDERIERFRRRNANEEATPLQSPTSPRTTGPSERASLRFSFPARRCATRRSPRPPLS